MDRCGGAGRRIAARLLVLSAAGAVPGSGVAGAVQRGGRPARRPSGGRRPVAVPARRAGARPVLRGPRPVRGSALPSPSRRRPAGRRPGGRDEPAVGHGPQRGQHADHAGRPAVEEGAAEDGAREAAGGRAGRAARGPLVETGDPGHVRRPRAVRRQRRRHRRRVVAVFRPEPRAAELGRGGLSRRSAAGAGPHRVAGGAGPPAREKGRAARKAEAEGAALRPRVPAGRGRAHAGGLPSGAARGPAPSRHAGRPQGRAVPVPLVPGGRPAESGDADRRGAGGAAHGPRRAQPGRRGHRQPGRGRRRLCRERRPRPAGRLRPERRHPPESAQHGQHPQAVPLRGHGPGGGTDPDDLGRRHARPLRGLQARELRPPFPGRGACPHGPGLVAQRPGRARAAGVRHPAPPEQARALGDDDARPAA